VPDQTKQLLFKNLLIISLPRAESKEAMTANLLLLAVTEMMMRKRMMRKRKIRDLPRSSLSSLNMTMRKMSTTRDPPERTRDLPRSALSSLNMTTMRTMSTMRDLPERKIDLLRSVLNSLEKMKARIIKKKDPQEMNRKVLLKMIRENLLMAKSLHKRRELSYLRNSQMMNSSKLTGTTTGKITMNLLNQESQLFPESKRIPLMKEDLTDSSKFSLRPRRKFSMRLMMSPADPPLNSHLDVETSFPSVRMKNLESETLTLSFRVYRRLILKFIRRCKPRQWPDFRSETIFSLI
jgi:hypothetical protein